MKTLSEALFETETPTTDVNRTTNQLIQDANDIKREATRVAKDAAKHAAATANYASAVAQEKFSDGVDQLTAYVKEKPLTCILAAASIGYTIGWLRNR